MLLVRVVLLFVIAALAVADVDLFRRQETVTVTVTVTKYVAPTPDAALPVQQNQQQRRRGARHSKRAINPRNRAINNNAPRVQQEDMTTEEPAAPEPTDVPTQDVPGATEIDLPGDTETGFVEVFVVRPLQTDAPTDVAEPPTASLEPVPTDVEWGTSGAVEQTDAPTDVAEPPATSLELIPTGTDVEWGTETSGVIEQTGSEYSTDAEYATESESETETAAPTGATASRQKKAESADKAQQAASGGHAVPANAWLAAGVAALAAGVFGA